VIDVPQPLATAQVRSGQWLPLSSTKDYPEMALNFSLDAANYGMLISE